MSLKAMDRRRFLKIMGAGAAAAALPGLSKAFAAKKTKPNILFLFADDQRPDTVAAFGNRFIRTPNLDKLAKRGFTFENNYCMGSTHGAVCQPSRAMLMSGRTLYRTHYQLKDIKILPELLKENGYVAFGTGKWHNGPEAFIRGFDVGRNVFFGGMSNHQAVPCSDIVDGKAVRKPVTDKFSTDIFADTAIEFLRSHKGDKPFFAYVAFSAPHDPRMPLERDKYDPGPIPPPKNFLPAHPFHNGWLTGRDEALAPWPRTRKIIKEQLADYYAMISHVDRRIADILKVLDEKGLTDNTIVVYSADHGLAMGSHGLLGKQNLYEGSMDAPLIFAGPGIPGNKTSRALVYLLDIYPTLCGLVGADCSGLGVEGRSLAPILKGEKRRVRDSLYTTYQKCQRAVRTRRWKLIRYPKINKSQLFDLRNDPDEMRDLSEKMPEKVEEMMELLKDWQKKVDDKTPLTTDKPSSDVFDYKAAELKRRPDRHQPQWIVDKYFGGRAAAPKKKQKKSPARGESK